MSERAYNIAKGYRYGFNGKEKDDEVNIDGNVYDFGSRIYDSRIGKWLSVDPRASKYSDLSPYDFVKNNPIIFVDPSGETDFYAADGKWIGTDGKDNQVRTVVRNGDVIKDIKKSTKGGMYYTVEIPKESKFELPPDKVLQTAISVFVTTVKNNDGKVEYDATLKKNVKGEMEQVGDIRKGKETDPSSGATKAEGASAPPDGDVHIHSHPTGTWIKYNGNGTATVSSVDATQPSMGLGDDVSVFERYELNIIVGKRGIANANEVLQTGADNRVNVVAFFSRNTEKLAVHTTSAIVNIYQTDTNTKGDNYKSKQKFNKKHEKAAKK